MGHSDRALVPIFMSSRPHYEGVSCPTPNVPTYEFRCPSGHDFERFFKTISTAPSQVECPECGAVAGRQLSSGAGLVFKGSGFYLTDYGKNAHRKAAPETKSDAKSDAKSDSGGDSSTSKADTAGKSESKAESKPKDTSKAENPSPKPSAKPKKE
jgi:putative FmdB family regulatory protein